MQIRNPWLSFLCCNSKNQTTYHWPNFFSVIWPLYCNSYGLDNWMPAFRKLVLLKTCSLVWLNFTEINREADFKSSMIIKKFQHAPRLSTQSYWITLIIINIVFVIVIVNIIIIILTNIITIITIIIPFLRLKLLINGWKNAGMTLNIISKSINPKLKSATHQLFLD